MILGIKINRMKIKYILPGPGISLSVLIVVNLFVVDLNAFAKACGVSYKFQFNLKFMLDISNKPILFVAHKCLERGHQETFLMVLFLEIDVE